MQHASSTPVTAERAHRAWSRGREDSRRGNWSRAAEHYRRAVRHSPRDPLYHLNLANAMRMLGDWAACIDAATLALKLDPANAIALSIKVEALTRMNRHEAVAQSLDLKNLELLDEIVLQTCGASLLQMGYYRNVIDIQMECLARNPGDPIAHYRLGLAFNGLSLKQQAAECLRTALALGLGPMEAGVRDLLFFYQREACDWHAEGAELKALRDSVEQLPDDAAMELSPLVHATLLDDPVVQLRASRTCSRYHENSVEPLPPRKLQERARLRIGYVSADIRQHATSFLMAELFERHDSTRFETYIYSHGEEDGSDMLRRIESAPDHFIRAQTMTPRAMAECIRADGIDILVDLKGYTRDSRPAVFAHRPAPIQVAWLGFPGTTGSSYIDYLISDPYITPRSHQPWFTEKILHLPGCYQCNDGTRPLPTAPSRASQGLPEGSVVFCSFNQSYKISPEVFNVWCFILQEVPGSVLWLLRSNYRAVNALREEAAARGVDPDRLLFADNATQARHLDRIGCADIYLDTWPCNGHTTVSDMLWSAVPVVTLSGRTFASRVAGSLLTAVGADDLICTDVTAYAQLAIALGHDAQARAVVRQHLAAARLSSDLFRSEPLVRALEGLYEQIFSQAMDARRLSPVRRRAGAGSARPRLDTCGPAGTLRPGGDRP